MWSGKGDASALSFGSRGFNKTSMSSCIFIQPYPFLHELMYLSGEDGLVDRFLIFSAKPVFNNTLDMKEKTVNLNNHRNMNHDCMAYVYCNKIHGVALDLYCTHTHVFREHYCIFQ